ncbi:hypothetical protein P753_gp43 [Propionibacterium phage PHL111M01]|uniref:Uncharacterized protein n=1 Tax=Propionibacterium phage PHL111M01 TaxID=1235653 RepID=T1R4G0_9CAUD|nr:hypothetical protein P753_gp43 [Propionibacterium phage PHL111M01]AGI12403.1 hypothetical protein PHL111M01_43 [Propionibacterium phage PHL111M01]
MDSMPRSDTSTFTMQDYLDSLDHLPHPLSPIHAPETPCMGPRIDQQGQPYNLLPPEDLRR